MTNRSAGRRTSVPSLHGRRLIVVDVENVVGGAVVTRRAAAWAYWLVKRALGLRPDEQVVVGVSHRSALETGLAWPGARLVVRSGLDGADRALIDVLSDENISERFSELVLVSGDGIFTDAIAALAAQGVHVTVAAHPTGLAKRLRLAAGRTVVLADISRRLGDAA